MRASPADVENRGDYTESPATKAGHNSGIFSNMDLTIARQWAMAWPAWQRVNVWRRAAADAALPAQHRSGHGPRCGSWAGASGTAGEARIGSKACLANCQGQERTVERKGADTTKVPKTDPVWHCGGRRRHVAAAQLGTPSGVAGQPRRVPDTPPEHPGICPWSESGSLDVRWMHSGHTGMVTDETGWP